MPRDGLQGEKRSRHVDLEHGIEIGALDLDNRRGGEDRGVVDQDVDLPEPVHRLGDSGLDACLLGHVHLDRDGRIADVPCGLAGALEVDIGEGDLGPLRRIGLGESQPDPARGAGYQG